MELIRHAGTELEGAEAVIVGRSILVGRPLAALLLGENATVTVCHSRTRDLAAVCSRADILVAAVGSPRLVTAEMVKPGATVIDVGTNRTDDGLVGDVDFEAVAEVAGAITPVPGGVGPMTIAMLLANTARGCARAPATRASRSADGRYSAARATIDSHPTRRDMDQKAWTGEKIAGVSGAAAPDRHVPELVRGLRTRSTPAASSSISATRQAPWESTRRSTPGRPSTSSTSSCSSRPSSRSGWRCHGDGARRSTCRSRSARSPPASGSCRRSCLIASSPPIGAPVDRDRLSRKFGVFLGLIAAAGIAYGGWMRCRRRARRSAMRPTASAVRRGSGAAPPPPPAARRPRRPPGGTEVAPGRYAPGGRSTRRPPRTSSLVNARRAEVDTLGRPRVGASPDDAESGDGRLPGGRRTSRSGGRPAGAATREAIAMMVIIGLTPIELGSRLPSAT